jgi:hypothetical protein
MRIFYRNDWHARAAREERSTSWAARKHFAVHHSGANPNQSVQEIQNFHMDTRRWVDIGYNYLVRPNGDIYEGRGWLKVGAHIEGHNTEAVGVCVIGNYDSAAPSAAVKASLAYLYAEATRLKGGKLEVHTHRQYASTACPGDKLHAWVVGNLAGAAPAKPSKPAKPSAGTAAPGPRLPFPLPAGHYFGPADGPNTSVSGRYPRSFKGNDASYWLKQWATQLGRRGWDVGKGRRWLTHHGNDGRYGDEYAALAGAFQRDQRLNDDELIGKQTWNAAFLNPVT